MCKDCDEGMHCVCACTLFGYNQCHWLIDWLEVSGKLGKLVLQCVLSFLIPYTHIFHPPFLLPRDVLCSTILCSFWQSRWWFVRRLRQQQQNPSPITVFVVQQIAFLVYTNKKNRKEEGNKSKQLNFVISHHRSPLWSLSALIVSRLQTKAARPCTFSLPSFTFPISWVTLFLWAETGGNDFFQHLPVEVK